VRSFKVVQGHRNWYQSTIVIIIIITVNLYSAFFVKKTKRAACASLVEREEKGFEVVLKR